MNAKTYLLATAFVSMVAGSASAADIITKAPPMAPAPFFLFMDTQISYWHEFSGAEPGVGKPIQKDIVSITHFDVWKYGTNFVNIDFLKSDNHDPAAPWGGVGFPIPPGGIGQGALEVYALYRGTLSWNALSGSKAFSFGPVKDIGFYYGWDLEHEEHGLRAAEEPRRCRSAGRLRGPGLLQRRGRPAQGMEP